HWLLLAAVAVAVAVFSLYRATLLRDLDFGDSAFFQFRVATSVLTPRDGYPLYFGIGKLAVWITGAEPARAMNLLSAFLGAVACGILVVAAAELSGSIVAGVASGLLFGGSYTFWSQSIIAEVYSLHLLFVGLTIWSLLRWELRPTSPQLALFFATYALGFGNHLSMILLAPAYALFLLTSAPGGWRSMLTPRVVLL